MKRKIKRTSVFVFLVVVFFIAQVLFYYRGVYVSPEKGPHSIDFDLSVAEEKAFKDEFERTGGIVYIDRTHENDFAMDDLNVLISRLLVRGVTVNFVDDNIVNLSPGSSFLIVNPMKDFSKDDLDNLEGLVSSGGRIVLISEPESRGSVNKLAVKFGMLFEDDYLYNLKENDANFKNIFVYDFVSGPEVTKKLDKVVLYNSCSISSNNAAMFTDENTFSSSSEAWEMKVPMALVDGKVLGVCDATFLKEPYNGILDNNQLISNVADFLAGN